MNMSMGIMEIEKMDEEDKKHRYRDVEDEKTHEDEDIQNDREHSDRDEDGKKYIDMDDDDKKHIENKMIGNKGRRMTMTKYADIRMCNMIRSAKIGMMMIRNTDIEMWRMSRN